MSEVSFFLGVLSTLALMGSALILRAAVKAHRSSRQPFSSVEKYFHRGDE